MAVDMGQALRQVDPGTYGATYAKVRVAPHEAMIILSPPCVPLIDCSGRSHSAKLFGRNNDLSATA
eukprot:scaffold479854_cov21-Prasinocladus_malaysianus.AAC.1